LFLKYWRILMNMRIATPDDLLYIYGTLIAEEKIVLVRVISRPDMEPYPLLDICAGPMYIDNDGLHASSLEGVPTILRITSDTPPLGTFKHVVELKKGNGEWYTPEFAAAVLLIPDI
jgi:hypothetical protein